MSAPARAPARMRFPGVRAPKPLLAHDEERRLTARQRQVLDALEDLVVREDLADRTMAEIAAEVNCSLRTLYEIAPSKDELVLAVVDRRLHRIGRAAIDSLDTSMSPLEALRAYLRATGQAVHPAANAFNRDFADVPGAKSLLDGHEGYVMAVTKSLLDRAVQEREIRSVDTAAVAHVLGGLGREFSRPEVSPLIAASPARAADELAEIIFRGLTRS